MIVLALAILPLQGRMVSKVRHVSLTEWHRRVGPSRRPLLVLVLNHRCHNPKVLPIHATIEVGEELVIRDQVTVCFPCGCNLVVQLDDMDVAGDLLEFVLVLG